jgi:hypothetical protein
MIILPDYHLSLSLSMLLQFFWGFFFGHLTCDLWSCRQNPVTAEWMELVSCGEYTVLYVYVFQYFISVFCTAL